MTSNPRYDVVSPLGIPVASSTAAKKAKKGIVAATPLSDLSNKRVGFIWTKFRNGDVLLAAFAELLGKRFPGMEFLKLKSGQMLPWGDYPDPTFGEVVRENRIDAVIAAPAC